LQVALHVLQDALATQFAQEQSPVLLLCAGEVYSQAGDMVTALECFQKARRCAPNNPLCYVNAARTYQQLNQASALHHSGR
jgi:predicted Zn-dependent protease